MPKITELTYSYGRTLQVEAFNPINIHASIKVEVGEGETVENCFNLIKAQVMHQVNNDVESAVIALRNPQPKAPRQINKFKGKFDGVDAFGNPLK